MAETFVCPASEEELDALLSQPTELVRQALQQAPGDILILGAGGKMGPTLARMCRQAASQLGDGRRVIAVSRFSSSEAAERLQAEGVERISCNLLDRQAIGQLPEARNVIFMAGQKFGTSGAPATTWAMNTLVPAIAAERFASSRIVVFSSGNVYPLSGVTSGGSRETDPLNPVGEYAQSCVGRERMFEYFAAARGTPVALYRLNYAIDLRYGVLTDIGLKVFRDEPVDVTMGHVNVIWQGDANARAIACLPLASAPPFVLNVTGAETLAVRQIAQRFGEHFGREPSIVGQEASDALLSNAERSMELFGPPNVPVDTMIFLAAQWIRQGGCLLGKPTRFDARDGSF